MKLLRRIALGSGQDRPRGRIHTRKIAGVETLAHERALPFLEGHFSWIGSEWDRRDLGQRSSTKELSTEQV